MPPSHNGIAPVLRTGPYGLPGSIPGGGVEQKGRDENNKLQIFILYLFRTILNRLNFFVN